VTLDALVVLGCAVHGGGLPPPAARRVARAAAAYRQGVSSRVVVSGGRHWDGFVEADVLGAELVRHGVPETALLYERQSRTTRENARYTAELLGPLGARKVFVVSCDWHLPRALFCFERVGLEAEAVPAHAPPLPFARRTLRQLREEGAWLLDRALLAR
jgi:uncharacterized SAM-binding protein YcdF (DUF218 family)